MFALTKNFNLNENCVLVRLKIVQNLAHLTRSTYFVLKIEWTFCNSFDLNVY